MRGFLLSILNILAAVLVLLLEIAVDLVATLADGLSLAQVVHAVQPLARVALGSRQDRLHLRVVLVDEQLATVVAHASQNAQGLVEEASVKNGLGKFNMAKVTRTVVHVAGAGLTAREAINDALSRVHDAAEFWLAIFV